MGVETEFLREVDEAQAWGNALSGEARGLISQ